MRRIVGMTVAVAVLSACNRDKTPDVPVQQQSANPAPATNAAPSPVTRAAPSPARPATPSPEALAAAELASAPRVRTVQVAALPNAATARWWVAELQKSGIPAYTTTAIVDSQEVTRLRVGAALTVAEARALADRIQERYRWPVWITVVDDKAALPANALFTTRAFIR